MDFLGQRNLNQPSHVQKLIESCHTQPDLLDEKDCAAIYVDGSHHFYEGRKQRDAAQTECMDDIGYRTGNRLSKNIRMFWLLAGNQ